MDIMSVRFASDCFLLSDNCMAAVADQSIPLKGSNQVKEGKKPPHILKTGLRGLTTVTHVH